MRHNLLSALARVFHALVAQICNLPCRETAFGAPPTLPVRWNLSALCRLQIGDTAEGKSALQPAGKVSRGNRSEMFGLACRPSHVLPRFLLASVLAACFGFETQGAEPPRLEHAELLQMSLEDLGKIQVTTVSRKNENLSSAAAAIQVITNDDIRRSGVNSLPEALRMAPGLEVARANSRQWAISSRGFNGIFSNKLLVSMDGRTIYTPLFSGVFWEETDTVLEDVDRIEVIRGPGATLWGANAVNGVINIITKSAKETQGTLISGGGGMEELGFGTVRYGGQFATNVHYRVYGKYSNRDEFRLTDGGGADDSWWMSQTGFRLDWEPSEINRLTWQGDYYFGDVGGIVRKHSLTPPRMFSKAFRERVEGANILGRWTHEFSAESDFTLQTYFDQTDRGFGIGREKRDTFDIDAQHRFHLGARNEIVWGAGYRYSADEISESPDIQMRDPSDELHLISAFVQDEITIVPDRLRLTLGTKVERNDFTGFEYQPSGRIAWTPHKRHTIWGAVSRAVRTPTRTERDLNFFVEAPRQAPALPLPILFPVTGNRGMLSEEVLAYEVGYRVEPHRRVSIDWTAFYNDYEHLRDGERGSLELRSTPANTFYIAVPLTIGNDLFGETYGTEVSTTWQPLDAWRLRASYTLLKMNLHSRNPPPSVGEADEGFNPQHQFFLWSDVDLGRNIEVGIGLRHVSGLPSRNIDAYTELDARLAWKPTKNCELAIIGRNLLDPHHREFGPHSITAHNIEVERSVFAKLTLRF
jgi:iron complex outermembrane receptor protein